MIIYRNATIEEPAEIICDHCGHRTENTLDSFEYNEYLSIDHTCGYESIIGDGTRLRIDLCQQCIKDLLLPFARTECRLAFIPTHPLNPKDGAGETAPLEPCTLPQAIQTRHR